MRHKKFVIWDWNGTLLDDVRIGYEVFAEVCVAYGIDAPSLEDYQRYYQHPIELLYKAAGFDLEKISMESIAKIWHSEYSGRLDRAQMFTDARTVLEQFHRRGVTQSVLSALPHEMLLHSIERNGIAHYLHRVQGLADNLGRSKVENGIAMLRELRARPDEVILFGDSSHDFETAQALGIDCMLFTRGYEDRLRLTRHRVPVHDDFSPILAEIGEKS